MSAQHQEIMRLLGHKFTLLLAALVFVLIVAPLTEGTPWGGTVLTIGLTAVLITGVTANRGRRWIFRSGLAIAAVGIPVSWAAMFTKSAGLDLTQYLIVVFFCGSTAVLILIPVVRDYMATQHAVVGTICVYLLIGLTWAMVYSAIEYVEHEPFRFAVHRRVAVLGVEHTSFAQITYFSFVTMSTLGYGDITPQTPLAETACWMQAIVGQLYIAILIARLISELSLRRPKEPAA